MAYRPIQPPAFLGQLQRWPKAQPHPPTLAVYQARPNPLSTPSNSFPRSLIAARAIFSIPLALSSHLLSRTHREQPDPHRHQLEPPSSSIRPAAGALQSSSSCRDAAPHLHGRRAPPRCLGLAKLADNPELACPRRPSPSRASCLLASAKAILFLRVRPRCCSAAPSRFVSSSSRPRGRQVPGRQDPSSSSTCMYDYLHATNCGVTRATSTTTTVVRQVPLRIAKFNYHVYHYRRPNIYGECTTTTVYNYRPEGRRVYLTKFDDDLQRTRIR